LLNLGRGYAAGVDLWITQKAGLSTRSTPAWTTLCVTHISTASVTTKRLLYFKRFKNLKT